MFATPYLFLNYKFIRKKFLQGNNRILEARKYFLQTLEPQYILDMIGIIFFICSSSKDY